MKAAFSLLIVALCAALLIAPAAHAQSVAVTKTNPTKVYMHYMPWFQTPASQGGTDGSSWGIHWTMANENPNVVDASGKRQIASHYYPMIGPYDSTDPNVLEYHMLLLKYSGVDGLLVDWYGQKGTNGDVNSLLTASNAIVNQTNNYGLGVGVVLEDNFAGSLTNGLPDGSNSQAVSNVTQNMQYLAANYFNKPNYLKAGASNSPLMPIFGPSKIQPISGNSNINSAALWSQIFSQSGTNPTFMPLEYQSSDAGTNADGEFAWPYQSPNTSDHLSQVRSFYTSQAASLKAAGKTVGGIAYPGFNDFYAQGGWGSNLFYVPETDATNQQSTLSELLNLYTTYSSRLDFLQLATFNDYGEGTQFEPTVEDGFTDLNRLQQFTGVSYGTAELQLIYQLYLARKKYAGHTATQAMLDQVSADLDGLDVSGARALLNQASPAGDFNGDGIVDVNDYNVWRASFGSSTIIHGSGADGNFDGAINAADYIVWRNSMSGGGGAGAIAKAVPEPSTFVLCLLAALALKPCCRRHRSAA
ncbi:MAG TPA: hypothetical protein VGI40_17505 [Pirellulaceae bacterium]